MLATWPNRCYYTISPGGATETPYASFAAWNKSRAKDDYYVACIMWCSFFVSQSGDTVMLTTLIIAYCIVSLFCTLLLVAACIVHSRSSLRNRGNPPSKNGRQVYWRSHNGEPPVLICKPSADTPPGEAATAASLPADMPAEPPEQVKPGP